MTMKGKRRVSSYKKFLILGRRARITETGKGKKDTVKRTLVTSPWIRINSYCTLGKPTISFWEHVNDILKASKSLFRIAFSCS